MPPRVTLIPDLSSPGVKEPLSCHADFLSLSPKESIDFVSHRIHSTLSPIVSTRLALSTEKQFANRMVMIWQKEREGQKRIKKVLVAVIIKTTKDIKKRVGQA